MITAHSHVETAKSEDFPKITKLINTSLGQGFIEDDDLENIVRQGVCYVAKDENNILAVATASIAHKASDVFPTDQEYLWDDLGLEAPVGFLRSLAFADHAYHEDLAARLVRRRVRFLKRHGVKTMLTLAWTADDLFVPNQKQLESSGFRQSRTINHFWTKQTRETKRTCPQCGPHCQCPVTVFLKID